MHLSYGDVTTMLKVRFSTGLVIQYNSATYAHYAADGKIELRTSQQGSWVATAPAGSLVEAVEPCRVYMEPSACNTEHLRMIAAKEREIAALRARNSALRRKLRA
jgi:hypothetical protein